MTQKNENKKGSKSGLSVDLKLADTLLTVLITAFVVGGFSFQFSNGSKDYLVHSEGNQVSKAKSQQSCQSILKSD